MVFQEFMAKDRCTVLKKKIFSLIIVSLIITVLAGCGGGGGSSNPTNATGSVSLAWDVPTTYVDGTPVTGQVGFKVYYGTASRTYTHFIDVKTVPSCTVNALAPGTYYFAITAYDSSGSQSDFSIELSKTIL
jgi:hypothetical protein